MKLCFSQEIRLQSQRSWFIEQVAFENDKNKINELN